MKDSINRQYNENWLQYERPQPMYDKQINKLYDNFYISNPVHDHKLEEKFKEKFIDFLDNLTLNDLHGYKKFKYLDITIGCTHFIDDLYMRCGTSGIQIFENDYKYHYRLNEKIKFTTIEALSPKKELIIAMPFPYYGDVHPKMTAILDKCYALKIPVHIDGAWITCCKDITFDFNHPAITSFCISLSKGGLGGNRIGVRFSKIRPIGAISIMNDFNMNNQSLVSLGSLYLDYIGPDFFWKKYNDAYAKVCADFNLLPTKAIHLAKTINGLPVGVRPLLRCLIA